MKKYILFILLSVLVVITIYVLKGRVIWDHSAEQGGDVSIYWNGFHYIGTNGEYFQEEETLAKTKDGQRTINSVVGDDEHLFVVNRSFYENWLLVREDYEIPKSGNITVVIWNHQRITDSDFLKVMNQLMSIEPESKMYGILTSEIHGHTDRSYLDSLWVGYENCPVGTDHKGFLGTYEGKWVFVDQYSETRSNGAFIEGKIRYFTVPEEYIPVLEQYMEDELEQDYQELKSAV